MRLNNRQKIKRAKFILVSIYVLSFPIWIIIESFMGAFCALIEGHRTRVRDFRREWSYLDRIQSEVEFQETIKGYEENDTKKI